MGRANPASMFRRRIDGYRERIEELPRPSDAQNRPIRAATTDQRPMIEASPNGGSGLLRGFRGHSARCRPPTPMPVDPALTALWAQDRSSGLHGPALPYMDFRNRASSNFSSNIMSESGSTGFVEDLVRLQAEAAGDNFFLNLGGAAEDRLYAAEPPRQRRVNVAVDTPELTIVAESSGLMLAPVTAGSIWSARAAAFARCDLGGDHAPWDRLAAVQRPRP
jgi:hypothetical protein